MNKKRLRTKVLSSAVLIAAMISCNRNDIDGGHTPSGPDHLPRQFVTLTAAISDGDVAGNGGTVAYALTLDEAADPNTVVNIYSNGHRLRSQRTARVQGSVNGNFLYNIQYTGVNGGVFNKYRVAGAGSFEDTNEELNVSSILGTSPRWVKAKEGLGIGVNISGATAPIDPVQAEAGTQTYRYTRGTASVALINLDNPSVPNTTEFEFPLSQADKEAGYAVTRLDVPVVNGNKIYIGCWLSKVNTTGSLNRSVNAQTGQVTWSWPNDATNIRGTVTLVLDYPSLANPRLTWSTQSQFSNNAYRTMTQYVGTDGHVYQTTGQNLTSYPHLLRLDRNTGAYDNSYLYNLADAVGTPGAGFRAWRYLGDGIGIAVYTIDGTAGGYIALVNLNTKTATKLTTDIEKDDGFFGHATIQGTLTQYQNIGVVGDYAYVPMTPNGKEGFLYVVNWRNGTIAKGARLTGQAGSFYIGAY